MNNLYKKIYSVIKSQPMVKYILCSVFTAFIETVLGLILVNAFSMGIVVANTISIVIGTVVHYFLVTRSVFSSHVSLLTISVYLLTFLIGLALQNAIIWLFYDILLVNVMEWFRFLFSKGISLGVSFLIMYKSRQSLYRWVDEHK